MQLTGDRFTSVSALVGNDLSTLPEFPAEIRAPAGTLAGVSAFQVHISDHEITTPGDAPNVLVAMNPAALRVRARRRSSRAARSSSTSTPSTSATSPRPATTPNPLNDGTLDGYTVYEVPMTSLTKEAAAAARREAPRRRPVEELLRPRARLVDVHPAGRADARVDRAALRQQAAGARRQHRRVQGRLRLRRDRRAVRPHLRGPARRTKRRAPTRTSPATPRWRGASSPPAQLAKLPLFLGSYPITPASDILHELSKHKNFGVRTLQAEDEIAGDRRRPRRRLRRPPRRAPPPAARAWPSRPRRSAWRSASSCRCSIIDIQRGGPSTGLPTKTEAADLLHGDVRPPRRVAAADRRRPQPGALLRRRHRGGPHRARSTARR